MRLLGNVGVRFYPEFQRGLYAEGAAATASLGCVGIGKYKTFAIESALVIESHAQKIKQALSIHDNFGAVGFENFITVFKCCIEIHFVGETGAAAALNEDAQKRIAGEAPSSALRA